MAELRYYQHDAVVATYRHLREKSTNPCIDVSVGGGKSWIAAQIMSDVVKAWGGRVILLCHVKELLEQDLEKLNILSPDVKSGMYSAGFGRYDTDQPAIVAGIQSVYNKAKLFGHRDICIVDEAHMIQPNDEGMYGRFVDGLREINPKIRFVGMTATPYRLKGGLICQPQNLFNEICYSIGLKELIDKGFLSKLVAKSGKTLANLDNIHVRAGEFVAEEVEAAMMEQRIVASACREIVELTRDRKSVIVFCSSVAHSRTVAQLIAQYSGEECAVVTGDTPAPERAEILHRFKGGSIQTDLFGATKGPLKYVANVECLTTGFDAPNIDCVALLRPTDESGASPADVRARDAALAGHGEAGLPHTRFREQHQPPRVPRPAASALGAHRGEARPAGEGLPGVPDDDAAPRDDVSRVRLPVPRLGKEDTHRGRGIDPWRDLRRGHDRDAGGHGR